MAEDHGMAGPHLRRASGSAAGTVQIQLRALREADRSAYIAALRASRSSVAPWVPLNEPGETDDAYFDRQLERCEIGEAMGQGCRRVALTPEGAIAGCFNLNAISRGLSWDADAAIWVAEGYRGSGVAKLGLSALLAHAFEPLPEGLGLTGVHAGVEPSNAASVRVVEACGFARVEGQQSHLKIGERWVRHDLYIARPPSL